MSLTLLINWFKFFESATFFSSLLCSLAMARKYFNRDKKIYILGFFLHNSGKLLSKRWFLREILSKGCPFFSSRWVIKRHDEPLMWLFRKVLDNFSLWTSHKVMLCVKFRALPNSFRSRWKVLEFSLYFLVKKALKCDYIFKLVYKNLLSRNRMALAINWNLIDVFHVDLRSFCFLLLFCNLSQLIFLTYHIEAFLFPCPGIWIVTAPSNYQLVNAVQHSAE